MDRRPERIALLGSTGSIGRQTLDVVHSSAGRFEVAVLTADRNWELLVRQAREFLPDSVVISNKEFYKSTSEALAGLPIKVWAGEEALAQVVRGDGVDTVVNALVGYAGLAPTMAAIDAGKKFALANKESLVVAGREVMRLSAMRGVPVLPIDSEHSAVLQCLAGEKTPVRKIILTASGGPFLETPSQELENATVAMALNHPRWSMGAKITIDSATMLNKGFEVIEAHWLFGLPEQKIGVVVHPQSVVHSMVEFADGSLKAQLGRADMRLPISYALHFPDRELREAADGFDFADFPTWDFRPVDDAKFPAIGIARDCLRRGGTDCCVLNAANEVAVAAFLAGRIKFTGIMSAIEATLARASKMADPKIDDYRRADREARVLASEFCR